MQGRYQIIVGYHLFNSDIPFIAFFILVPFYKSLLYIFLFLVMIQSIFVILVDTLNLSFNFIQIFLTSP